GAAAALPLAWREQCEELRLRLRIGARVHLALSGRVSGPCTLGWWRPVVLLPLSALTALPPEQVTALLAHELAHIRRHDYLVNLFQRGLEVVFFFHPAVWWLSHQMSDVREICCDDLAVAACGGDRAAYARALVELAELAAPGRAVASIPASALAATGGALGERVRCLLGSGPGAASRRGLWRASVAMVMVAATGLCLLSASGQSIAAPPVPAAPQAPVLLPSPQATAPSVARSAKEGTLAPLRQAAAPSPRPLPLPHRLPLPRPVPPRPLPPAPPHPPAPSAATTVMQGATRPLPPTQPLPPAPPLPPPGLPAGRTSVLAFTLTGFQACVPEIAWVPQILPSGQMVLRVETLVRCFPLVNPTEVLVISTI
ncbi:MAG: M56 family metallopeptidase, partial [Terriglobales bacterium]